MKRLQLSEDGRPRLFFLRGSAIARDHKLLEAKEPTATEEEFELYLWQDGVKDSVPVKQHDHGLDALRYVCMHLDGGGMWSVEEIMRWSEALSGRREEPPLDTEARQRAWEEEVRQMNAEALRAMRTRGGW